MPTLLLMAALVAAGLLASAPAMLNLAAQAERDWQLASDDRNRDWDSDVDFMSWNHLALAENLSPEHGFASFYGRRQMSPDTMHLTRYHRFPVLGHLLIKLATSPFPDNAAARVGAARTLMLACFASAGALAWLALRRLARGPPDEDLGRASRPEWPLLGAVLLAFSSHHALYYADLVATEGAMDLFAVMLAFHGVAVFATEGRFGQLLAKVCLALLLGWHVFALVGPLALLGLGAALRRRNWRSAGRYFALGAVAILLGAALVGVNLARERAIVGDQGGASVLTQPSSRSALARLGITSAPIDWATFAQTQLHRLALATVPYAIGQVPIGDAAATYENWEVLPHSPGFEVAGGVLLLTTLGLAGGGGRRGSVAAGRGSAARRGAAGVGGVGARRPMLGSRHAPQHGLAASCFRGVVSHRRSRCLLRAHIAAVGRARRAGGHWPRRRGGARGVRRGFGVGLQRPSPSGDGAGAGGGLRRHQRLRGR